MLNSTFDKAPNLLQLFSDCVCVCVGGGGGGEWIEQGIEAV